MVELSLKEDELKELIDIVSWAISEGYMTNSVTKSIIKKIGVDRNVIERLQRNCNIGENLFE